ncbi:hypothetical protein, partial [Enterococcus faecalis]|uniref:hypothetical protein n=1 Tax=Enterococcus faecalis TaxID=1351 RepID=UPI003D6C51B4
IRTGQRTNLAYFIFADIVRDLEGNSTILHGMILSHFFEASRVDMSCDAGIPISRPRIIGSKSLAKIGYVVRNRSLVPRRREQEEALGQMEK